MWKFRLWFPTEICNLKTLHTGLLIAKDRNSALTNLAKQRKCTGAHTSEVQGVTGPNHSLTASARIGFPLSLGISAAFCVDFILHQTVSKVQFQPYTADQVFDLTKKANLVLWWADQSLTKGSGLMSWVAPAPLCASSEGRNLSKGKYPVSSRRGRGCLQDRNNR